jgi:hypothetical protein
MRVSLLAAILLTILADGCQNKHVRSPEVESTEVREKPDVNKMDLQLDKESATQIGEIVLVHVYGRDVLKQRPWHVRKDGDVFTIEGSFGDVEGGEAVLEISARNAAVISIIHTK